MSLQLYTCDDCKKEVPVTWLVRGPVTCKFLCTECRDKARKPKEAAS